MARPPQPAGGDQQAIRERRNDPHSVDRGRPRGCLCRRLEIRQRCRARELPDGNAKGEAGHAAKATHNANENLKESAKKFGGRITVDCKPKGDKVICYAQGTACKN